MEWLRIYRILWGLFDLRKMASGSAVKFSI